jgi:protein TonB
LQAISLKKINPWLIFISVLHALILLGLGKQAHFVGETTPNILPTSISVKINQPQVIQPPIEMSKASNKKNLTKKENEALSNEKKPTPPPSQSTVSTIQNAYLAGLRNLIEQNKYYPLKSKRLRQQGDVTVGFTLKKDGQIEAVKLIKSAGYPGLDQAALDAILKIGHYQPIPNELNTAKLDITQSIKFELN